MCVRLKRSNILFLSRDMFQLLCLLLFCFFLLSSSSFVSDKINLEFILINCCCCYCCFIVVVVVVALLSVIFFRLERVPAKVLLPLVSGVMSMVTLSHDLTVHDELLLTCNRWDHSYTLNEVVPIPFHGAIGFDIS